MKRPIFPSLLCGAILLSVLGCGADADASLTVPEPSQTELDAIDEAAASAAAMITPETADREFEKLEAELGRE